MDKVVLAYLAGVIDSDGYISIKRSTYGSRVLGNDWSPQYQERIGIKQVRPEAIDLLKETFGGYRGSQKPSTRNGQPLHVWQATNLVAARAIAAIQPYLRIKSAQADIALALRASKNSPTARLRGSPSKRKLAADCIAQRERWFNEIKGLNDTRATSPRLI